MTQEEKDLLLRDLCARLPYGVFMGNKEWNRKPYQLTCDEVQYLMMSDDYEDVPYLRPMDSMTEEEWKEAVGLGIGDEFKDSYGEHRHLLPSHRLYDWLNAHHFDYRGLIEKGLAISTEEFNPYKD